MTWWGLNGYRLVGRESAAFQAAGIAEALFRGCRLTLQPASTRRCRQDAGAPRGLGV